MSDIFVLLIEIKSKKYETNMDGGVSRSYYKI